MLNNNILRNNSHALAICKAGLKTQALISRNLDHLRFKQVRELNAIDQVLWKLLYTKQDEEGVAQDISKNYYVWRSRKDNKVRPSHAANEGQIFSWDKPPLTGNPGSDFNCRCKAGPVKAVAEQKLLSDVVDKRPAWTNWDLVMHYYFGGSDGITLSEIGYLGKVINYYAYLMPEEGVYKKVNAQIFEAALEIESGSVTHAFSNIYDFQNVLYSLRKSTVSGNFEGKIERTGSAINITGTISYNFYDEFSDPGSLVEATDILLGIGRSETSNDIGNIIGAPYTITDHWQTEFTGSIFAERE